MICFNFSFVVRKSPGRVHHNLCFHRSRDIIEYGRGRLRHPERSEISSKKFRKDKREKRKERKKTISFEGCCGPLNLRVGMHVGK